AVLAPGEAVPAIAPAPPPPVAPVPALALRTNAPVTAGLLFIVTVHVAVPLQPPPVQPANVDPVAGVAVKVTIDPNGNCAAQVLLQSIPAGELLRVPDPLPVL